MGYKGTIRSLSAAANKASREHDKTVRQKARELAKMEKKIGEAYEKLEKIFNTLEDIYAQGKINKKQYENLKKRKTEISIDLVVLGKAAGVSLAKRYITGKINEEEFNQIKADILPEDMLREKEEIRDELATVTKTVKDFLELCDCLDKNKCSCCEKEKSLFSPVKESDGVRLCGKCRGKLSELQKYKGYKGTYFSVDPCNITISDINDDIAPQVQLNSDLL